MRRRLRARVGTGIRWLCMGWVVAFSLAGIWTGWIAPRLDPNVPTVATLRASLEASSQTSAVFLGADLTTLGVIIAIIIGYNVAAFQVAAQTLSLTLVRAILYTLMPFLGLWLAATGLAMVYLLTPPPVVGALYQAACWFGATVIALIGYLLALPSRLSGEYAARWSIRDLAKVTIGEWESTEGFTVLQTGIGTAVARADIGTLRMLAFPLARFLCGCCDREAERNPVYNRARFYALRGFLAGCAPSSMSAPGGVWYVLGYLDAGILLQSVAVGAPFALLHATLVDDGIPKGPEAPSKMVSLWAGLRHALCRPGIQGAPYLRSFWRDHANWTSSDLRSTGMIAEMVAHLCFECWAELAKSSMTPAQVADQCADFVSELYRYLWQYLPEDTRAGHREHARYTLEGRNLIEAVHTAVRSQWPANQQAALGALDAAYARYKGKLDNHTGPA